MNEYGVYFEGDETVLNLRLRWFHNCVNIPIYLHALNGSIYGT